MLPSSSLSSTPSSSSSSSVTEQDLYSKLKALQREEEGSPARSPGKSDSTIDRPSPKASFCSLLSPPRRPPPALEESAAQCAMLSSPREEDESPARSSGQPDSSVEQTWPQVTGSEPASDDADAAVSRQCTHRTILLRNLSPVENGAGSDDACSGCKALEPPPSPRSGSSLEEAVRLASLHHDTRSLTLATPGPKEAPACEEGVSWTVRSFEVLPSPLVQHLSTTVADDQAHPGLPEIAHPPPASVPAADSAAPASWSRCSPVTDSEQHVQARSDSVGHAEAREDLDPAPAAHTPPPPSAAATGMTHRLDEAARPCSPPPDFGSYPKSPAPQDLHPFFSAEDEAMALAAGAACPSSPPPEHSDALSARSTPPLTRRPSIPPSGQPDQPAMTTPSTSTRPSASVPLLALVIVAVVGLWCGQCLSQPRGDFSYDYTSQHQHPQDLDQPFGHPRGTRSSSGLHKMHGAVPPPLPPPPSSLLPLPSCVNDQSCRLEIAYRVYSGPEKSENEAQLRTSPAAPSPVSSPSRVAAAASAAGSADGADFASSSTKDGSSQPFLVTTGRRAVPLDHTVPLDQASDAGSRKKPVKKPDPAAARRESYLTSLLQASPFSLFCPRRPALPPLSAPVFAAA